MLQNLPLILVWTMLTLQVPLAQSGLRKANPATGAPTSSLESPFIVGEQLKYNASWSNFLVAGELTLQTKDRRNFDGIDAYHVRVQAQSVGFVDTFIYKINDIYESFINAATLRPFRAESRLRHGDKQEQTSLIIDQQRRTARLTNGRTIQIPPDTYDLASLFYAFRTMDLTPGKARIFTLLEDEKLYTVRAEPEAPEKARTAVANYEAVRVAIKLVDGGEIKDPYKLRLYLSVDSRHLPVLLTAEPTWGKMRVELASATGSKPTPNGKTVVFMK